MRIFGLAAILSLIFGVAAASETRVRIAYLEVAQPQPPVLSNLDPAPSDLGLEGARLGLADNATTDGSSVRSG